MKIDAPLYNPLIAYVVLTAGVAFCIFLILIWPAMIFLGPHAEAPTIWLSIGTAAAGVWIKGLHKRDS